MTDVAEVSNQVQKIWSPIFMEELREDTLLLNLVNKDYQGDIRKENDTVYVSQVNKPQGQNLTVGVDANSFQSTSLSTSRVAIVANKRAVASFEFSDLVDIQSQINGDSSPIREALRQSVAEEINNHLYSLVSPSASSPDHIIPSVTDMNKTQLGAVRKLAAKAKWKKDGWIGLLDPSYYSDILADAGLTSRDFAADDNPVIGGQVAFPRFGFNLFEDNSRETDDYGLFFHPDFMHLVMQTEPTFKISDLHSNKQFGYVISLDIIYGAALGIDGDKKHIVVTA